MPPAQSFCRGGQAFGGGEPNRCLVPPRSPWSLPSPVKSSRISRSFCQRRTKWPSCPVATLNSEPYLPAVPPASPAAWQGHGARPGCLCGQPFLVLQLHHPGSTYRNCVYEAQPDGPSTSKLGGGTTPRASPPLPPAGGQEGWHQPGAFWEAERQSVRTLRLPLGSNPAPWGLWEGGEGGLQSSGSAWRRLPQHTLLSPATGSSVSMLPFHKKA